MREGGVRIRSSCQSPQQHWLFVTRQPHSHTPVSLLVLFFLNIQRNFIFCKCTSALPLLFFPPILPFYISYLIEYVSKLDMDLMVIYF